MKILSQITEDLEEIAQDEIAILQDILAGLGKRDSVPSSASVPTAPISSISQLKDVIESTVDKIDEDVKSTVSGQLSALKSALANLTS